MKGGKKKLLGGILVERGALTPEQLHEALTRQKEGGERLGQVLQELGFLTEEEVLQALSDQLGVPIVSLADPSLNLYPVINHFPQKFMKQYRFFPLDLSNGVLSVVMADPLDFYTLDDIRLRTGYEVKVLLGREREVLRALDQYYSSSSTMEKIIKDLEDEGSRLAEEEDVEQLKDMASEAPVVRLVNLILSRAVESRASDVHVEPFEGKLRVRYRIDGVLIDAESPPKRLQAAIVSRIKIMAKMNIAERRLPQDGRIRLQLGGQDLDIRVSTIPTIYGESIVMRLLDRSNVLLGLGELGFGQGTERQFETLIKKPHGIILVTGPTGSGKTTTLYGALRELNSVEKKIITIEDPVEYQLEGVNQIQVKPKIGLSFASGLRHIVRQDPDIILVGEIRDAETAEIAIHAALTGHLVLSTLHTNDAAGAITRLLDMGIEDYLVSSTLVAVLAQRLVRKICLGCKVPYVPEEAELRELGLDATKLRGLALFKGQGCSECNFLGYKGRIGIYELLVVTEPLQRLILQKADANQIKQTAVERGMKPLREDGWEKVKVGITTIAEVVRVAQEDV
ncbi:MAG: type II secretion system ATPase GspE [candidate division NC10 bacterium]|nr:type II secretion system ATPase GspE [candidate division NC10 bacterium]